MKELISVFLLLWMTPLLYSQDTLTSKRVDQKTLHHYYQGEWKPLIQLGKQALKEGIDFKYLRYRMGVAHYELGHFNEALPPFKLVEKETLADTTLQEYIYYSYLFAGREKDARIYAEKMDNTVRQKVGFQKFRFLDEINLSVGGKFSTLADSVGHMPIVTVGLTHQLGTRLKYSHHFTFLTQNYLGLKYNQYQYYGKAEIALVKGLQLFGAFHYTGTNGQSSYHDSIFLGEVRFDKKVVQTGLVGMLGFQGNIGGLNWKAYGSISNWRTNTTTDGRLVPSFPWPMGAPPPPDTSFTENTMEPAIQYGVELSYRIPVSKQMWFDVGGHFALQHQRRDIAPIWGVKVYGQLTPKIGLSVEFLQANTTYFLTNDASFASNTVDVLNARVAATFNYQINPKLNWFFNYSYENRVNENFNFDYHSFFTGLKFKL